MEKNQEYFEKRGKELEAKYAIFKKFDELEKERNIANGSYANRHINELSLEEYNKIKNNHIEHEEDIKWWYKNMSIFNGMTLWGMLCEAMQLLYIGKKRGKLFKDNLIEKWKLIQDAREMIETEIRQFNSEYYDWHYETYGWNAYRA